MCDNQASRKLFHGYFDHIFTIRQILEQTYLSVSDIMISLNLIEAFDSVDREVLHQFIIEKRIPEVHRPCEGCLPEHY